MWFIKLIGLVVIVVTCTFLGMYKSRLLAERCKKLTAIYDGTSSLYEQVEGGGCELVSAMKNSFFNAKFLRVKDYIYICDDSGLTNEDSELINSFFNTLGLSSKKIECDKINSFKARLSMHIKDAKTNYAQKGKIYQTFGICIGLTLAVLLV